MSGGGGGGFDGKTPGRQSGVTASDLVSGNIGQVAPGKTDLVGTHYTGVAFADDGATCEGKGDSVPGCFMSDGQRGRLIELLIAEINTAQTNYKIALVELKVEKLIEKDDDLPWVIGLALDLVSAHLTSAASKALNKLKNKRVARLEDMGIDAARREGFDEGSKAQQMADALDKVSDKSVETAAKAGFDLGKKKVSKTSQSALNETEKTDKGQTVSYIDQLKQQCDVGYKRFLDHTLATATDAELVVIYRGFDPEYHSVGQYKVALAEKIQRYKKSGVTEIGQHAIAPHQAHVATVYANRRCVWLLNADGSKALWFYSVLSGNQPEPWTHGRAPDIERVPDEFVDAALVKSEEKWGQTPVFEHPAASLMRRMGALEDSKPTSQRVASRDPKDPLPRLELRDVSQEGQCRP
jgi:hypothetical protein